MAKIIELNPTQKKNIDDLAVDYYQSLLPPLAKTEGLVVTAFVSGYMESIRYIRELENGIETAQQIINELNADIPTTCPKCGSKTIQKDEITTHCEAGCGMVWINTKDNVSRI